MAFSSEESFGEEENVVLQLEECDNCGRKFNIDVLERHEKICAKLKKRKVFDSSKQRLEGLEEVPLNKKNSQQSVTKTSKKKADWRWKHEEFIKNIRAARNATAAIKDGKDVPPPEPSYNPDYIQCPYCNRRFNESAAERHINFCKEQKSRLPKSSNSSKTDQKKEQQQKRTQYRPPVPGSKKKSLTPAKRGSPATNGKASPKSVRRESSLENSMRGRKNYDTHDESPINTRYSRTGNNTNNNNSKEKPLSGKTKNGDPKWFEDLKRADSGNKLKKVESSRHHLDEVDSHSLHRTSSRDRKTPTKHQVGVVHPSQKYENGVAQEEAKVNSGRRRMANFCHDCGTRYPVPTAKFCCECGVRRMALT